jgi:hypothetical protein
VRLPRRKLWIGGTALVVAVAVALGFYLFWSPPIPPNEIHDHIAGELRQPSVLSHSTVVFGDPESFALSGFLAAKLAISPRAAHRLLSEAVVFNDCKVSGRECSSSPTWSGFHDLLGFTKLAVPADALCAQSHQSGERDLGMKMVCVDSASHFLYYYAWSDDSHF